jgi:hypothetical protein
MRTGVLTVYVTYANYGLRKFRNLVVNREGLMVETR